MKSLNFVRCSAEYSGINSMAAMPPANTEKSAKRSTAPPIRRRELQWDTSSTRKYSTRKIHTMMEI